MIVLQNLTKTFVMRGERKTILDNVNAVFPSRTAVGLLGRNGAGKSTLLKMIAGTALPTSGQILTDGKISFPVGFAGSFHPDLTGAQNIRFVARIYGVDTDALIDFVRDFAELGVHFHLPIRSYSSGMKARLAFGVSMGLRFDTYLIDEVTAVGDASFVAKSNSVFLDRMKRSGAVFVSHSIGIIREMCTAGAVLDRGKLTYYPEVEEAIEEHLRIMEG
jgi:capsular polysaccharide transport system ATP-binding protein